MRKILLLLMILTLGIASPALAQDEDQYSTRFNGPALTLEHICTLPSGKELFFVISQENKTFDVRVVTAFDDVPLTVETGDTKRVRARVSQGSYPVAELILGNKLLDRVRVQYSPCDTDIPGGSDEEASSPEPTSSNSPSSEEVPEEVEGSKKGVAASVVSEGSVSPSKASVEAFPSPTPPSTVEVVKTLPETGGINLIFLIGLALFVIGFRVLLFILFGVDND